MASLDLLERLRPYREQVEVLERKAPRELVAADDITRTDALGRNVVVVPAGTVPAQWVTLTDEDARRSWSLLSRFQRVTSIQARMDSHPRA
jgi:hypothetical protein